MKAVRLHQYGSPDNLRIEEVEKPAPVDKQVLIRVHAASINASDYRAMRADPFIIRFIGGLRRPKDPLFGTDVAGVVEAVGENVTQFRPGDAVFGCANGSFAEYVLARESYVAPKPAELTFQQAAAIPTAGLTALQMIRVARESHDSQEIRPEHKFAIQGASGGVGTFAVQLAKHTGAEVTAVCSPHYLDLARALGADRVVDYKREDVTSTPDCYDFIFGVNGYHPISHYRRALKPGGVYLCVGGGLRQMFEAMLLGSMFSKRGDKKLSFFGIAKVIQEDLTELAELAVAGKIPPVIDRTYPLAETIAAMHHVEKKHPQGKIVLTVT